VAGLLRAAGCGAFIALALSAGAAHGRTSVGGCAAAAERAVGMGITLRALPPACRGLRALDLQRAAIIAINEAAGPWPKARHRHLAGAAAAKLRPLLGSQATPARPRRRHKTRTIALVAAGRPIPVGLAALIAWLCTVVSGGYLLTGWIRAGGLRRGSGRGRPPPVILGHFGLATAGLICWVGYVISGVTPVAWLAIALLLPVAGLGMATLMLAIPDTGAARRPRMPVLAISAHGIFATVTMLLVLLAAISSSGH
jgi:manganese efflux pump family protein